MISPVAMKIVLPPPRRCARQLSTPVFAWPRKLAAMDDAGAIEVLGFEHQLEPREIVAPLGQAIAEQHVEAAHRLAFERLIGLVVGHGVVSSGGGARECRSEAVLCSPAPSSAASKSFP